MKLDLLKENYHFELTRKQQLESSLTLPIAVLTGLGGVTLSYAKSFRYGLDLKTYLFAAALCGAIVSLLWVFYHLIRATHRFTYEVVPSSLELLTYYEQTTDYYRQLGAPFKVEDDFETELKRAYANASSKNRQNNISKAGFLYRAYMGLVTGAVFIALCSVPSLIDEMTKPAAVQKVEVVNVQDLKLEGGDMPVNQNKPAGSSSSSNEPGKPSFPSNTGTKEGSQPQKPSFPSGTVTRKQRIDYKQ